MDKCPLCKNEILKKDRVLMRTHSGKKGISYPMHSVCLKLIQTEFNKLIKRLFGDDFKGE